MKVAIVKYNAGNIYSVEIVCADLVLNHCLLMMLSR